MDKILDKSTATITIVIDEPLNAQHLQELQDQVAEITLGFGTKLILDCTNMDYICSSGLRIFLGILKQAESVGATLIVRGVQPLVRNVFDMTGFTSMFQFE